MISLAQYARNVYQFASKDTEDHIVATVLRPLGLVSSGDDGRGAKEYFSCFALPPATTNVRLAGSHPVGQVASVPRELSGTVAYSATSMAHIGLPYCICVRPVVAARSEWPLLFSPAQKNSSLPLDDDVRAEAPVVVVVDTGCGEAVLRGADVFVPGIYTCSAHFSEGQRVLLGVYMERPPPSAAGSGAQPAKPCSSDLLPYRFKFATAHTLPPDALIPPTESETGSQPLNSRVRSHNSADAEHYLVVIGEGVARMDRGAVFARAVRGVAVEVTWTPFMQPSMAVLERLSPLGSANQPQGTASVFLQNYSSMVPPQLLVNRLSFVGDGKPLMLLDACAAPGGKTSLLLSLMKHKAEQEAPGSSSSHFRLVCCERSLPRFKSLVALLQTHFPDQGCEANSGNGFLSQTLRPLRVDVNKLTPALAQADASLEPVFDGILLDPPCTGMGLRPRFQPHSISRELIADHADYQRTLFRSCMLYLCAQRDRRPQGRQSPVIVYSTCTITMEENEGNVLHFLKSYPSLRLARARTAAEVTLCNSVAVNTHDNGPRFLLEEEIMAVQREREAQGGNSSSCDAADDSNNHELGPVLVLRFMPKPHGTADCTIDDGVGFFVAVFERSGACLDSEPAVVEQVPHTCAGSLS